MLTYYSNVTTECTATRITLGLAKHPSFAMLAMYAEAGRVSSPVRVKNVKCFSEDRNCAWILRHRGHASWLPGSGQSKGEPATELANVPELARVEWFCGREGGDADQDCLAHTVRISLR